MEKKIDSTELNTNPRFGNYSLKSISCTKNYWKELRVFFICLANVPLIMESTGYKATISALLWPNILFVHHMPSLHHVDLVSYRWALFLTYHNTFYILMHTIFLFMIKGFLMCAPYKNCFLRAYFLKENLKNVTLTIGWENTDQAQLLLKLACFPYFIDVDITLTYEYSPTLNIFFSNFVMLGL